ncbi:MAG: tRNA (adenosine(37)-N6)-threonylcarbamoyltransferase complex dimerization subunit type 1 TsaB [Candidatus Melainabacteria bacterium]|nr:tRNA (adenosine(37)-N6)-threonylcarbamoyltransferase complex dimerization subunit type 1 TsaB [Candidatus Melainabacteria bacterium]
MRILAFDTSCRTIHLCLLEDGAVIESRSAEPSGNSRQEAVTMLVPLVDQLMKQAGWLKAGLSALVVGLGPGSFTGLRIGVVTARTLAQALNLPVLGISTLECLAWAAQPPVGLIVSQSQGHFFVAAYCDMDSLPVVSPVYLNAAKTRETLPLMSRWVADQAAMETLGQMEPLPVLTNIACCQAQIAWDRLSLKLPVGTIEEQINVLAREYHWSHVEPLYLRGPSVTVKGSYGH